MNDIIMILGTAVLAVLFFFLLFVFIVSTTSLFIKRKNTHFEPKISVVIPCYNEEKHIGQCLESIFLAEYPQEKIEIIVVDDGSTDSTVSIIKGYQKKHKNLKIVQGGHEGKSESLNRGVKAASNEFIMTIDADTSVDKRSIALLVDPLSEERVGATNGSCIARNKKSMIGAFQSIEYHYNNLIRRGFSRVFQNGIWFFGFFACYRKEAIENMGYFKKHTLTEDMDAALEMFSHGYKIINVDEAYGYTDVPSSWIGLMKQRIRWWAGVMQSLWKHRKLFSIRSGPSIIFLFLNQYWWSFYAIVTLPLIGYQFAYWLPSNMATAFDLFMYTFRWFSLLGPIYVLYMIPVWGINLFSIFGVLSGLISAIMIIIAIFFYKDRLSLRNLIAVFFYFPYTIILNTIILISLLGMMFLKKRYFIS